MYHHQTENCNSYGPRVGFFVLGCMGNIDPFFEKSENALFHIFCWTNLKVFDTWMNKEGSTKKRNQNLHTPGRGGSCAKAWPYCMVLKCKCNISYEILSILWHKSYNDEQGRILISKLVNWNLGMCSCLTIYISTSQWKCIISFYIYTYMGA